MHIFPTYSGNSKLQGSTTNGYGVRPFQSPPFQSTSTAPPPPPPSRPSHLVLPPIASYSAYDSDEDEFYDSEDEYDRGSAPSELTVLASKHLIHPVRDASLRLPPLLNHAQAKLYPAQGETLPPIYRQFMRELSNHPTTPPALPDVDPPTVPRETCVELRKYHINPFWVVLPPFGEPCHFRSKESCFRADWRNAMWERHIQTHLPGTMKEFWECPHCLRPFNRKCAFVNHLRKTKTECGSRGTLETTPESRWKDMWFHEPMPLRHPEDAPRRRWHTQKEEPMPMMLA